MSSTEIREWSCETGDESGLGIMPNHERTSLVVYIDSPEIDKRLDVCLPVEDAHELADTIYRFFPRETAQSPFVPVSIACASSYDSRGDTLHIYDRAPGMDQLVFAVTEDRVTNRVVIDRAGAELVVQALRSKFGF